MNNRQFDDRANATRHSRVFVRLFAVALLALAMTGCDAIGSLASNDRVTDADNNQVITLGDSIYALSGELQDNLEEEAGMTFRRYTRSGSSVSSGAAIAEPVVDQYARARNDDPDIRTVVMNGGGNDILIPAIALDPHRCKTRWYQFGRLSSKCKALIDDIYVEVVDMLNEMAADGVDNVVYLGYYYTKNGLFRLANMKEAVDYGTPRLGEACANSVANCVYVDPRSTIVNSDIIFDGIHPNSGGSEKLADLIWPELQPLL